CPARFGHTPRTPRAGAARCPQGSRLSTLRYKDDGGEGSPCLPTALAACRSTQSNTPACFHWPVRTARELASRQTTWPDERASATRLVRRGAWPPTSAAALLTRDSWVGHPRSPPRTPLVIDPLRYAPLGVD